MTKPLTRIENIIYHYVDSVKVDGAHERLHGDVTGLSGDITDLRGYVTGLSGNVTGLSGYVTDLRGNVDEIPQEARPCNISDWVEE